MLAFNYIDQSDQDRHELLIGVFLLARINCINKMMNFSGNLAETASKNGVRWQNPSEAIRTGWSC